MAEDNTREYMLIIDGIFKYTVHDDMFRCCRAAW